jgi:hypothetical protein
MASDGGYGDGGIEASSEREAFSESSSRRLDAMLDRVAGLRDPGEKRRCADMYKHLASKQREALGAGAAGFRGAAAAFEHEYAVCAPAFAQGDRGDRGEKGLVSDGDGDGSDGDEAEAPTAEDTEEFRRTVRTYFKVGDDEREARKRAVELAALRRKMEEPIVAFMRRFRIDDVETRDGKLRCITRTPKLAPNKSDMERRIADFFGEDVTSAEALRGNLFEPKGGDERVSLRRVAARLTAGAAEAAKRAALGSKEDGGV